MACTSHLRPKLSFFKRRLVYFRQLSYILGTMSLIVTVLLITTLLTITVNALGGTITSAGTATASIVSGPGAFVGSPTCNYPAGGTSQSCQVTITLSGAPEACPDFCLVQRLIAVGVTPTQVPLGVVSCDLLVVPIFVVSLPPGAGNDFVFNLPPFSIAGLQVYVHGGNVFSTPSGYVYEVSNGLHLDYF